MRELGRGRLQGHPRLEAGPRPARPPDGAAVSFQEKPASLLLRPPPPDLTAEKSPSSAGHSPLEPQASPPARPALTRKHRPSSLCRGCCGRVCAGCSGCGRTAHTADTGTASAPAGGDRTQSISTLGPLRGFLYAGGTDRKTSWDPPCPKPGHPKGSAT